MSPPAVPPASAADALNPLDPVWVERFRRDLTVALGRPVEGVLALAVSGGPDSMAMLALAHAAFPSGIAAATVDHRLRPDSADEAKLVADWCRTAGIPHATLTIDLPREPSDNLHDWARQERYLLLKRWAVDAEAEALCTAHHAEDQAETFLMRAARGSGLSGLAAVRERVDDEITLRERTVITPTMIRIESCPVTVIRPLLDWRRNELRAIAESSAIPFVDDPSNRDPRFDRARFRGWLEQADWIDPRRIARAAAHLAEAENDLTAISHWFWRERARESDPLEVRLDVAELPRGVRRYLVRMAIDHVIAINGMAPRQWTDRANVESLLDALERGKGATRADVQASADGTIWTFREAPPRRSH